MYFHRISSPSRLSQPVIQSNQIPLPGQSTDPRILEWELWRPVSGKWHENNQSQCGGCWNKQRLQHWTVLNYRVFKREEVAFKITPVLLLEVFLLEFCHISPLRETCDSWIEHSTNILLVSCAYRQQCLTLATHKILLPLRQQNCMKFSSR